MGHEEWWIDLAEDSAEDKIWNALLDAKLKWLPSHIFEIFKFAVTEMLNNVIDHSTAKRLRVELSQQIHGTVRVLIYDNGVGIFQKIAHEMHLPHLREAALLARFRKC